MAEVAEVAVCGGCDEPAAMATVFLASKMPVQVEYRCKAHYIEFVRTAARALGIVDERRPGA